MIEKQFLQKLSLYHKEIVAQSTPEGIALWEEFLKMHFADIADVLSELNEQVAFSLFCRLPESKQLQVLPEVSHHLNKVIFENLDDRTKATLVANSNADDITDSLDLLSDEQLRSCLELLRKKDRQRILSLLKFPADSAGGIMTIDMVYLRQDFTVEKSIEFLQRLQHKDLYQQIYVTDEHEILVGYIKLEDLILHSFKTKLTSFIKPVPFVVLPEQDQEEIAQKMVHYHLLTIPVVDEMNHFLGVIPTDTLIDVIQQEALEDVSKMSGSITMTSYFDTTFFKLIWQRSAVLATLLIVESLTSFIVGRYEAVLSAFLVSFFTMLVSAGGNTSSQTSAIVIQGMSSGDINQSNMSRFIKREILIGLFLAVILATVGFLRIYMFHKNVYETLVVSLSLGLVVLFSVILGAFFPLFLKKMRVDPAFSAGPFLATLMDILGIFIYCYVAWLLL